MTLKVWLGTAVIVRIKYVEQRANGLYFYRRRVSKDVQSQEGCRS
jgi:hypothetical protein